MDKLQEKYKIFERMHKELKQNSNDQGSCKNVFQLQSNSSQSYWNHDNSGKPLQDFDMKPLSL